MHAIVAVLAIVLMFSAVPADAEPVDVELVLAVDSSASVDYAEFNLQLQGLSLAFQDAELARAIADGPYGVIAVTLVEWSSSQRQEVSIPWTRVVTAGDAVALADRIDQSPRRVQTGATSISASILFASALFENNGFEGVRRVIDLSGDGYNNQGAILSEAREAVVARGVTINALAIENQVLGLGDYFEQHLIGGTGAFVVRADDYQDYLGQIRRKLLRELQAPPMS
ncbi:MAG: DUF1194 domain-containing protein [Alphaproteobacteria bacterium]|nr:DUF1194 domain-containing protein [Alphaproteobacteria bacterium]